MSESEARRTALEAAIAGVWERMRPTLLARFETLERALVQAQVGALDDALRLEAAGEAHKLAGSLGMFGFPEGSTLARTIEQTLRRGLDPAQAAGYAELLAALKERLSA